MVMAYHIYIPDNYEKDLQLNGKIVLSVNQSVTQNAFLV